ncbi:protein kinase [Nocardia sp. NPDC059228]|uniref:serine/threonine-protein kinase n=1 Tax=Nocardia sp. NPDC059228 TaxID=3346777 RepID=UPI0036C70C16
MPGAGNLGHYRLVELIGRGGMGQVWLAEDTHLEREVALKLLPVELASDQDYRRRFEREARLAARLRGPHVVPIHAFGELDGRLYIDMELIEGSDLSKTLREVGSLPPDRAVDLITQIAEALDIAHRAGLVHRDVKPSNVLTLPSGFAYLIDFGIARGVGQATITSTGVAVGTWAYMAPERYSGAEDLRSDVYSLACLLYETLVGAKPFTQADPVQQMAAHLTTDPPRASDHNSLIPAALDAVIARGLAKDPDHRFQSAGALAAAARAALDSRPAPRTGPAPPTAKWDSPEPFPSYGAAGGRQYPTPPGASTSSPRNRIPTVLTPPPGGLAAGATPYGGIPGGAMPPPPGRSGSGTAGAGYPSQPRDRAPTPGGSGDLVRGATPPPGGTPGSMAGPVSERVPRPHSGQPPVVSAGMSWGATAHPGVVARLPGDGMPAYGAAMGSHAVGAGNSVRPVRISAGRVLWWILLVLLIAFFGLFTAAGIDVLVTETKGGVTDFVATIVALVVFVAPLAVFVWLGWREVKRFRSRRR